MLRALGLTLSLLVMVGCHGRFKRNVGSIDDVQLQLLTTSGASAVLPRSYYVGDPTPDSDAEVAANVVGSVASGVFNVVQGVKEAQLREKIGRVDIGRSNDAMLNSLASTLGGGPPFAVRGRNDSGNLLQLELVEWGLQVPSLGVQGSFTYKVRAKLFTEAGRKVYKSRLRCNIAAGDPSAVAQGLLVVNNAKQIKKMSDAELQDAFDAMAEYCGGVFVARMRQHAS
ncbi:MAG: hypothetical protein AAGA48_16935 [Myxococcota bacterium]